MQKIHLKVPQTTKHENGSIKVSFVNSNFRVNGMPLRKLSNLDPEEDDTKIGILQKTVSCVVPTAQTPHPRAEQSFSSQSVTEENSRNANINKIIGRPKICYEAPRNTQAAPRWTETNLTFCQVSLSMLSCLKDGVNALSLLACRVRSKDSEGHQAEWQDILRFLSIHFELGKLSVRKCQLTSNLTLTLCQRLHDLTELDLSLNKIGDDGTIAIAQNLKNLKILRLSDVGVTDASGIKIAQNLVELEELCLNDNQLTDQTAIIVARNLRKLRYLYLSSNRVADSGFLQIAARLNQLVRLWVRNNRLSTIGLAFIKSVAGTTQLIV